MSTMKRPVLHRLALATLVALGNPLAVGQLAAAAQPAMMQVIVEVRGGGVRAALGTVPVGKRMVLESVNAWCGFRGPDQSIHMVSVLTTFGGPGFWTHLVPKKTGLGGVSGDNAGDAFVVNESARAYADPETRVFVEIVRTPGEVGCTCQVTIAGYYVGAP